MYSTWARTREAPARRARVRSFTCTAADRANVAGIVGRPVTEAQLRAAIEDAAGRAVAAVGRAVGALASPSAATQEIFFQCFGAPPGRVPAWRPANARWANFGGLVATRLRAAAAILDGGHIRYHAWAGPTRCPECPTTPPAQLYACSSFKNDYRICIGGLGWRVWGLGDMATLTSTLIHEALHIFFGVTVAHQGSTGNANCYERFILRLNRLFLHPDTAASCPINLHRGSRGLPVRELQRRLNAWIAATPAAGLAALPVNGAFDARTEAAVRAFQTRAFPGAPQHADGVVGARTWQRLPQAPGSAVRNGSNGLDVQELQHKLNMWLGTRGMARLPVTGQFRNRTGAALRAFQTAHGLTANGIAGATTWAQLPPF